MTGATSAGGSPPARLRVESDLHGFRCVLPGPRLGSNSGWILPFVALWWVVGFGVFGVL